MDEMKLNVLVSLYRGYGLGDGVMMSAVLRHVVAARPNWVVDYQADEGRHQCGRGIVASTFAYGKPYPRTRYDAEVQIVLHDSWAGWHDRPNTLVSSCLHERFGLEWNPALSRYRVEVSMDAARSASTLVHGMKSVDNNNRSIPRRRSGAVAVHYQGVTSPNKKNLTHNQASDICTAVEDFGGMPVILDWPNKSPLKFRRVTTPSMWGGNAEMVCAVISQCTAFVGIDSGPGKCASATSTPSLIVWTGHHPAKYHDPAPNTTHLVPANHQSMEPVCNDQGVIKWFESNYKVRLYDGDPVPEVKKWLAEVLL